MRHCALVRCGKGGPAGLEGEPARHGDRTRHRSHVVARSTLHGANDVRFPEELQGIVGRGEHRLVGVHLQNGHREQCPGTVKQFMVGGIGRYLADQFHDRRIGVLLPEERDKCQLQGGHFVHFNPQPASLGDPPGDPQTWIQGPVRIDLDHHLEPRSDLASRNHGVGRPVETAFFDRGGDRRQLAGDILRIYLPVVCKEPGPHRRNPFAGGLARCDEHAQERILTGHQGDGMLPRLHRLCQVRRRRNRLRTPTDPLLPDAPQPPLEVHLGGHTQFGAPGEKHLEAGERSQSRRQHARHSGVVHQFELPERRQCAEFGGYGALEIVVFQEKVGQSREFAESGRHRTCQRVAPELQTVQFAKTAELRRNRTGKVVAPELQTVQFAKTAELRRNRAGKVVVAETQDLQPGQIAQLRRNRARKLVPLQIQSLQAGATESAGDAPGQGVFLKIEYGELSQVSECGRNRAGQFVGMEPKGDKLGQRSEFDRDRAGQIVRRQAESIQPGQPPELGRNRPGKLITVEYQTPELREAAEPWRDRTGQAIGVQPHLGQIAQLPEFGRYRPGKLVVVEIQLPQAGLPTQFGWDRSAEFAA